MAVRPVTYSTNVFVPVTNVCRNRCTYCGFVARIEQEQALLAPYEVNEILDRAVVSGCKEALFTLGEEADLASTQIAAQLKKWGYGNMVAYLRDLGEKALAKGLFPHTNAGILSADGIASLRHVNASMGLMLESSSLRLCQPGGPHHHCPGKVPHIRIKMIQDAGLLKVPFTTGILIGIGETRLERADTLWDIRVLMGKYGHIQEVIVQNFRSHSGTPMVGAKEPGPEELLHMIALARLILGQEANIQVAPNLVPTEMVNLLYAGANDFGGISPVTRDYINPEYPWPNLDALELASRQSGSKLRERLPIYPEFINREGVLTARIFSLVREVVGDDGYVKE